MEQEKGDIVPREDPLDLEEGELREDQATTVSTAGADSAEMEVEADQKPLSATEEDGAKSSEQRLHGKRRSESGDANGKHDQKRHKKKSKKDGDSISKQSRRKGDANNDTAGGDDEGTPSHKQHGDGAPDGEGDRKKRKEERSSANHHRDDHHSRHHHHHRDHKDHRDRSKHERSSSSSSASDDRRASEERHGSGSGSGSGNNSSSKSERERSRHRSHSRSREKGVRERGERDGERSDRARSSSREDRRHRHHQHHQERRRDDDGARRGGERHHHHERDDHSRDRRVDERDHRHRAAGDRRYEREPERGDRRDDRRYDHRRDDDRHRGYERGDDRRDRRADDSAAERKPQEQHGDDAKANQTEDADYARMVEEELRRKEKEQSEEEKAQKLIEERRKRRQAILEKYRQDKPTPAATVQGDKPTTAAAASEEEARQPAQAVEVATPQTSGEQLKAEREQKGEARQMGEEAEPVQEEPKKVTHFDMFNELPPSLIPSDQTQRPLGAAAATGEDELNLADNWDDEEGYYSFRIGEVINRRYTVHASHGKGVFSTVLIAKDSHNDDIDVAIKVIRNNDTMFRAGLKEKELLEKITAADPEDKKHCIRVLDSFQYRNHLCLVLEPMSMNLREVVKKFGRDVGITMRAVRTYARQLFLALKHLKKLNMLHADLKPDNIVLNAKLTVLKLCDFGSASLMEEENAITPYLVSRFYRAPEIMLGLPYDFSIDTWAAGCCLYEMYTGKILFAGKSNNEMLRMQMDAMGPFPRKMLRKSKFWQRHFNTQTFHFQQICIDEVSQQEYVKEVNVVKPVRDLRVELQKAATAEDVSQAGQLADLMLKCLNLDPAKRITPEVALGHPFLKG